MTTASTMSIPADCSVLVIGGGPGGSYTAAALAREGIDTVVIEGDVFPRYHIGESLLPSVRHFLHFVGLDKVFDDHAFTKKPGAAFKLRADKPEGYTDFVEANEDGYAWNVVRSEADEIMFRHAGKCGAKIYDGVRVDGISFVPCDDSDRWSQIEPTLPRLGRPVSASYKIKSSGETGHINFKYLIDASGRAGIMNTKYLKNRRYNKGLKNLAHWGYYKGTTMYKAGTRRENAPYFEALIDESGWAWMIPLHNGTTSVGVVMNLVLGTEKRKPCNSTKEFFLSSLKLAPTLSQLLSPGELVSDIRSSSDFSYSASAYALPYCRIVGDAGCFIDPLFSSGVHLALTGALSAALTISAALRLDCDEVTAAKWHSSKVTDSYERFKLVVLSAYRQMRMQGEDILISYEEENFNKAFNLFKPIIQGTADTDETLTRSGISRALEFCANAFAPVQPEHRVSAINKLTSANPTSGALIATDMFKEKRALVDAHLSAEEEMALQYIRARRILRMEDCIHLNNFVTDVVDGFMPRLEQGCLGLTVPVSG